MTTVKPHGARPVAPISQTVPRATPPVDDDSRVETLARRVVDGHPLSDAARDWLRGRGSNDDAPASLASDLGLAGFATFRDLAQAVLDHDASRQEIVETATRIARRTSRLDAANRPAFMSKLRNLRGTVPAELAAALGLAPEANWGVAAERLETFMSPKAGAR